MSHAQQLTNLPAWLRTSPADWVPAEPSACCICTASNPRRLPAVAAAASVPAVPVVWNTL